MSCDHAHLQAVCERCVYFAKQSILVCSLYVHVLQHSNISDFEPLWCLSLFINKNFSFSRLFMNNHNSFCSIILFLASLRSPFLTASLRLANVAFIWASPYSYSLLSSSPEIFRASYLSRSIRKAKISFVTLMPKWGLLIMNLLISLPCWSRVKE